MIWREDRSTLTPLTYYADFAHGIPDIGYDGYIGYELCHALPPIDGQPAGIDYADSHAQLAAEYMRGDRGGDGEAGTEGWSFLS